MAKATGINPEGLRDKNRKNFYIGDEEEISKMVNTINSYVLSFN